MSPTRKEPPNPAFGWDAWAPPANDPSWDGPCRELLAFLGEPRTVPAVLAWVRSYKKTGKVKANAEARQMLAWLSFNRRADYDPKGGVWRCL